MVSDHRYLFRHSIYPSGVIPRFRIQLGINGAFYAWMNTDLSNVQVLHSVTTLPYSIARHVIVMNYCTKDTWLHG